MKNILTLTAAFALCTATALAGFSERRLESAKKRAEESGKKIAFVFYQDYYLPNCPKCVQSVNANNSAIKKAIPRSSVVLVEIEKGDRDLDKLPSVVGSGKLPRIVVTDATTEKVIAKLEGAPDRDKARTFEEEVKSAE